MKDKYRTVFLNSPIGLEVLADILTTCHFGCMLDPDNKVQVSENNVGTAILHKCGIFAEDTLLEVVQSLAGVSSKGKEQEEEDLLKKGLE